MFEGNGTVKIYANGLVEGWPDDAPKFQGICNHLPVLLSDDQLFRFSKDRQLPNEPTSTVPPIGASHS